MILGNGVAMSLSEASRAWHMVGLEVVRDAKGSFGRGWTLISNPRKGRNVRGGVQNHLIAVRSITAVQIRYRRSKTIIIRDENSDRFSCILKKPRLTTRTAFTSSHGYSSTPGRFITSLLTPPAPTTTTGLEWVNMTQIA